MIRSYYATPIERRHLPLALDFTPDNSGAGSFPLDFLINPYQQEPHLQWTADDWDPALRFWTLPYDPHLREWLRGAERSQASTLAGLEFGTQPEKWHPAAIDPEALRWMEAGDLEWLPNRGGFKAIRVELEQLKIYMEDDRARYLMETDAQSDGLPAYMVHFIGADALRHPWTLQLVNCAMSIGHIAYMVYKAHYKRVRPSTLRPGLSVPFGPPSHPAFPSGHSFLGHFLALLLLELPGLAERFGVLQSKPGRNKKQVPEDPQDGKILRKARWDDLKGVEPIASPLLSFARRMAVNRERIGVHYPSDSMASRHLAAGIWDALINRPMQNDRAEAIEVPTLRRVLERAKAEWPALWP